LLKIIVRHAAGPAVEVEATPPTGPALGLAHVSGLRVPEYARSFDAEAVARQVRNG